MHTTMHNAHFRVALYCCPYPGTTGSPWRNEEARRTTQVGVCEARKGVHRDVIGTGSRVEKERQRERERERERERDGFHYCQYIHIVYDLLTTLQCVYCHAHYNARCTLQGRSVLPCTNRRPSRPVRPPAQPTRSSCSWGRTCQFGSTSWTDCPRCTPRVGPSPPRRSRCHPWARGGCPSSR